MAERGYWPKVGSLQGRATLPSHHPTWPLLSEACSLPCAKLRFAAGSGSSSLLCFSLSRPVENLDTWLFQSLFGLEVTLLWS